MSDLIGYEMDVECVVKGIMSQVRVCSFDKERHLYRGVSATGKDLCVPFSNQKMTFVTPDVLLADQYGSVWNNCGEYHGMYQFKPKRELYFLLAVDAHYMPPEDSEEMDAIKDLTRIIDNKSLVKALFKQGIRKEEMEYLTETSRVPVQDTSIEKIITRFEDIGFDDLENYSSGETIDLINRAIYENAHGHAPPGEDCIQYIAGKHHLLEVIGYVSEFFPFFIDGVVTSENGPGSYEIGLIDAESSVDVVNSLVLPNSYETPGKQTKAVVGIQMFDTSLFLSDNQKGYEWNKNCARTFAPWSSTISLYRSELHNVAARNWILSNPHLIIDHDEYMKKYKLFDPDDLFVGRQFEVCDEDEIKKAIDQYYARADPESVMCDVVEIDDTDDEAGYSYADAYVSENEEDE